MLKRIDGFAVPLFIKILVVIIVVGFFLFMWEKTPEKYNTEIGGWSAVRSVISDRYSNNSELKSAAIQMAKALQDAVDHPDDADRVDIDFGKSMACVYAVLNKQGADGDTQTRIIEEIRDLSTVGDERQRRYIHFNARLSGKMLKFYEPSLSLCIADDGK